MQRLPFTPRKNWLEITQNRDGFIFPTPDNKPYWAESMDSPHYYQFTMKQINVIDKAAEDVHQMCLHAVDWVVKNELFRLFDIHEKFWDAIKESWKNDKEKFLYGRFDFSYDGVNPPKMLEYNADTPTTLFEAGTVQWNWMEDMKNDGAIPENSDQFNRIHEDLIERFQFLTSLESDENKGNPWVFSSCKHDNFEDESTVFYLMDLAQQAGLETSFVYVDEIGLGELDGTNYLTDLNDMTIHNWFKLYPYEWLMEDNFGDYIPEIQKHTNIVEPLWKSLLSNKAILPILYYLFPDSEYILPADFEDEYYGDYKGTVIKPILSREGDNIQIRTDESEECNTEGNYGDYKKIVQKFHALPNFDGNYPVIGVWMIGHKASGMSIREADQLVTRDDSRFIPHIIID